MNKKDKIIQLINNSLDQKYIKLLSKFRSRKLVYTSFDGDYMHYISNMQKYCLKDNLIPINPESALGYYVSTTVHGNKKVPVMIDCLALSLICEEFYLFNSKNQKMPEGVIAEVVYWLNKNKKSSITIIDFFDEYFGTGEFCRKSFSLEKSKSLQKMYNVSEIEQKLFKKFENQKIKYGYNVANFYNYKHMDWVRAHCYTHNICPLSPQTILQYNTYLDLYDNFDRYIFDRLSIMEKADMAMLYINTRNLTNEIVNLDVYSKLELLHWIKNNDDFEIIDWSEISVPKYKDKDWALTTAEKV